MYRKERDEEADSYKINNLQNKLSFHLVNYVIQKLNCSKSLIEETLLNSLTN